MQLIIEPEKVPSGANVYIYHTLRSAGAGYEMQDADQAGSLPTIDY
jgi:hypothetical protein